ETYRPTHINWGCLCRLHGSEAGADTTAAIACGIILCDSPHGVSQHQTRLALMPVLGHAVVGLAIGMATRPPARADSHRPGVEVASVLWLPAVVVLAYLPDIITQVGVFAGWSDARLLGHSILFAVTASAAIAAPLSRVAAVSFHRAFIISLVSLVIHDVLDLAQATDRAPWWPLSERRVGF